jgi:hypothetical protein
MSTSLLPVSPRRAVVAVTVTSFSIAALLGIVALLGGEFGEGQVRVLLTTAAVGVASIAVLCSLATSESRYRAVGVVACAAVLVSLVLALLLVWSDGIGEAEGAYELFGVSVIVAGTLAQASLLLATSGDRPWQRVVLWLTLLVAGVLALVLSAIVLGASGDGDTVLRLIGVLAIADVLGTVVGGAGALGDRDGARPDRLAGAPVELPAALAERVAAYAARTGRAPTDVVVDAVERHLDAVEGPGSGAGGRPAAQSGT